MAIFPSRSQRTLDNSRQMACSKGNIVCPYDGAYHRDANGSRPNHLARVLGSDTTDSDQWRRDVRASRQLMEQMQADGRPRVCFRRCGIDWPNTEIIGPTSNRSQRLLLIACGDTKNTLRP